VVHIYDISNKPVLAGAQLVNKNTAFNTKYDLVICSNVLEHVPYPAELIVEIKNTMGKDTVLYVEVPYEDIVRETSTDQNWHLKKKHWHEHINFYTEKALLSMLNLCGLDMIATRQLNASAGGSSKFLFQVACKIKN
jgi:hypothetical protein